MTGRKPGVALTKAATEMPPSNNEYLPCTERSEHVAQSNTNPNRMQRSMTSKYNMLRCSRLASASCLPHSQPGRPALPGAALVLG
eukprot:COSAG01_NODE_5276_length_4364_cov_3.892380_7_plen_85_part_00